MVKGGGGDWVIRERESHVMLIPYSLCHFVLLEYMT